MSTDRRQLLAASAILAASSFVPAAIVRAQRDHAGRVRDLVGRMTLAEKLGQMTQLPGGRQKSLNSRLDAAMLDRVRRGEVGSLLHVAGAEPLRALQRVAVRESRLGIPLLFAMDVIHGYRTVLPVPLALAASWDLDVAEQAGRIAAEEAWAAGLHWTFTPMVDVARDPRWGRVVEGAGEDAYLGARMAAAQVRGIQGLDLARGRRLMACAKHFAGYGAAAGGRDYDSADLSERTLQEVYLPPFHAAMRAGAASFMTGFNDVGGVPMTANADLVRGELRGRWGYQGLIVSDWNAIKELINHGVAGSPAEAAALALRTGVDLDMASGTYAEHLAGAVAADPSLLPLVDEAVSRILTTKAALGLFDNPYDFGDVRRERGPVARTAARDLARRSIVLLRNETGLLPLKPGAKLALVGALADDASSALGSWRAQGRVEDVVTLRRALPQADYVAGVAASGDDHSGIAAAVAAAERADLVVLAIGEDFDRTGEARSFADIGLALPQAALVDALKKTGKPIVAVLMGGRPLALERALTGIPAVLQTWLLGIESGPAIADVLFGRAQPGGRLPITMPRVSGQVPMTYAHLPTGRPANSDLAVDSARYRDVAVEPLFPFGHGLSYTRFEYDEPAVSRQSISPGEPVRVSVSVRNAGDRPGEEVVQLYTRDPVASVSRPVKELRGFARLALRPGERRRVTFTLMPDQFAIWRGGKWIIEPGRIDVMLGASAADIRLSASFDVTKSGEGREPPAAIETRIDIA